MCLKAVGEGNIPYNQKSDKSQKDSKTQEIKIKNKDIQQSRNYSQENEKINNQKPTYSKLPL